MIFDRIDELKIGLEKKKYGRGDGRKPALMHLSLRIPSDVFDFFSKRYKYTKQAKMREILTDFMNKELTNEKTK
jgi:uncharacterized protein (DUF4415 family)